MYSRWFNAAVVLLWLATMSWLVTEKVLPPLVVGEPPNTDQIVDAQKRKPAVGWRILYNGRRLGWAVSETVPQATGVTEIHGRVHFRRLPLKDMMKGWLHTFSRLIEPFDGLGMDARSAMTIDALGHLVGFESAVRLEPLNEVVRVRGTVEGRQLQMTVQTGGAVLSNESFLPSDALLCDALSPQSQLPGLRAGQQWTVPVYSPLLPAKTPLEIIHATVDGLQPISWDGQTQLCWLVVYRGDPVSGVTASDKPRGRLWVHRDGTVLKQQIMLFDSTITFDRLSDSNAEKLIKAAGRQWWIMEADFRAEHHD